MWTEILRQHKLELKADGSATASTDQIAAWEARLRGPLPASLRELHLQIGAGFVGSFYVWGEPVINVGRVKEFGGRHRLKLEGDPAAYVFFGDYWTSGGQSRWDPLAFWRADQPTTAGEFSLGIFDWQGGKVHVVTESFVEFFGTVCFGKRLVELGVLKTLPRAKASSRIVSRTARVADLATWAGVIDYVAVVLDGLVSDEDLPALLGNVHLRDELWHNALAACVEDQLLATLGAEVVSERGGPDGVRATLRAYQDEYLSARRAAR